ncbi:MAG: VOC family protein, partial [Bacteroidota bacterium]|nr:VOC family protein [Bacteroidota bacterium]
MGIGIPDVHKAWKWYRNAFGIDIRMFEEAAEAALMTRYTGGEVHARQVAPTKCSSASHRSVGMPSEWRGPKPQPSAGGIG